MPLGSVEGPGSCVSFPSSAPRAFPPCRVVELVSCSPAGIFVEASRGSSGSPSVAAPAPTLRCELVEAPGDRECCDIASSSVETLCTGSLCVLKPLARLAPARRPGAVPGPSRSVSQQVLQNLKIECLVGHDPLQPSVLLLDLLQASRLVHLHTSVLRTPSVVRRLRDPSLRHTSRIVAPASTSCRIPMICSSRNRLFCMTPPFKESHNNWIRFRGSRQPDCGTRSDGVCPAPSSHAGSRHGPRVLRRR